MAFLFAIIIALSLAVACCSSYSIAPITRDMRDAARAIINYQLPTARIAQASSIAWQRLAFICDTFGPRFSGSQALEDALTHIKEEATKDGLRVTEQWTTVPKWVRGEEWAYMTLPRQKKLHMVGLGMSNSTQGRNITAEVIIFSGYDDMMAGGNCSKAAGKIILFNTIFTTYGETVTTRTQSAVWASQCGALAVLIRSIGPFSMQNPHTGFSVTGTIAAAAISNEDASQMLRMQLRGQKVVVSLFMENAFYAPTPSRNLLIDLVGTTYPDEYVLVSGHGDSWDVSEGAMDDGGGFMASWEAVRTIKVLGLKPKRTIRAVVWVNEENGDKGGKQYAIDGNKSNTLVKHSIAIETDSGIFSPVGIGVSCAESSKGGCGLAIAQLKTLSPLLDGIGGGIVTSGGGGADIDPMCESGVVCAGYNVLDPRLGDTSAENNPCTADAMNAWRTPAYDVNDMTQYNSGYFWFHHSQADTMEVIDPTQLNRNSAVLAIWTYAIAELPELLPRNAPEPSEDIKSDVAAEKAGGASIAVIVIVCSSIILGAVYMYRSDGTSSSNDSSPQSLLQMDRKGRLYNMVESTSDNSA